MILRDQLDNIIKAGTAQIKAENEKVHVEALGEALFRAATESECEVRLTYRTTEMATAAWTWMVWAAEKLGQRNKAKCVPFDVELLNGSGIVFWTDDGPPSMGKEMAWKTATAAVAAADQ